MLTPFNTHQQTTFPKESQMLLLVLLVILVVGVPTGGFYYGDGAYRGYGLGLGGLLLIVLLFLFLSGGHSGLRF